MTMDARYLLPCAGFQIEAVSIDADGFGLWLKVRSEQTSGVCPYCGQCSTRVHSWYARQPQDVASGGRAVRLQLSVRRFFCDNSECVHRVFCERLPELVAPYARRTNRVSRLMEQLGLRLGCTASVEVLRLLPVTSSRWTIARIVRRLSVAEQPTPRVLGVDDWAMRRGQRYGTILVDLEAGQVVDLLPDREADSIAVWLREHPGVEIISRDRGGAYADGAKRGAPQAIQVADRWHLLKNLGEAVTNVLGRHRRRLKQLEAAHTGQFPDQPVETELTKVPSPAFQARSARFAQVRQWRDEGLTISAIAHLANLDRKTIRKYLNTNQCPDWRTTRRPRVSQLASYETYLLEHADGQRTIRQLWRDIQAQGFTGSLSTVAAFLAKAHSSVNAPPVSPSASAAPSPPSPKLTPRRATWLLLAPPDELTADQRQQAELIIHLHPDVEQMATQAQSFAQLLRQHQSDGLDSWLDHACQSAVHDLRTFARGIQRDYEAVKAALSFQWSNGPVEGQVNRLKFLKRQMFGRASFDLLRIRVLGHAPARLQQKCT